MVCAGGASDWNNDFALWSWVFLDSVLFRLGYFTYLESTPAYYVIAGVSYVFVGLYLIRGAPHIVRFAYPREDDSDERNVHEAEADHQQDA